MSQIKTPGDIKKLGTILTVWAHPDDESFLAAGVIATAIKNGQNVTCVTATKGEEGVQDVKRWPKKHLGEIRRHELEAALRVMGVKKHHWLDYYDGQCADVDQKQAIKTVTKYIDTYKPDSILTFGPDGWTGHPDHRAVSHWVSEAVKVCQIKPEVYHVVCTNEFYEKYLKPADERAGIFFNIDKPPIIEDGSCDICFTLTDDVCEQKYKALQAQPSQTKRYFGLFGESFLMKTLSQECFKKIQN